MEGDSETNSVRFKQNNKIKTTAEGNSLYVPYVGNLVKSREKELFSQLNSCVSVTRVCWGVNEVFE